MCWNEEKTKDVLSMVTVGTEVIKALGKFESQDDNSDRIQCE